MNEELNKKLAKWAGIKAPKLWAEVKETGNSFYVGKFEGAMVAFLAFTESLDACFKWLVPKIQGLGLIVEIQDMKGDWHTDLWDMVGEGHIVACEDAETPALALCLAIEKLIDKGEVKGDA